MNEKAPSKADALRAMREARYTANSSPPAATATVLGELRTGDGQGAKAVGLPKGPATATNSADKRPKSSEVGVKESPISIPDYNGVKSPALVTAYGLSGKSCPLSRSEVGTSEAKLERSLAVKPSAHNRSDGGSNPPAPTIKRGRPLKKDAHLSFERTKPWESEGMSRATWYARKAKKGERQ